MNAMVLLLDFTRRFFTDLAVLEDVHSLSEFTDFSTLQEYPEAEGRERHLLRKGMCNKC